MFPNALFDGKQQGMARFYNIFYMWVLIKVLNEMLIIWGGDGHKLKYRQGHSLVWYLLLKINCLIIKQMMLQHYSLYLF